jgi:hypothetical protein
MFPWQKQPQVADSLYNDFPLHPSYYVHLEDRYPALKKETMCSTETLASTYNRNIGIYLQPKHRYLPTTETLVSTYKVQHSVTTQKTNIRDKEIMSVGEVTNILICSIFHTSMVTI